MLIQTLADFLKKIAAYVEIPSLMFTVLIAVKKIYMTTIVTSSCSAVVRKIWVKILIRMVFLILGRISMGMESLTRILVFSPLSFFLVHSISSLNRLILRREIVK